VTSLSTYIVTLISRTHLLATLVNGYDVKTPVGHEVSNPYTAELAIDSMAGGGVRVVASLRLRCVYQRWRLRRSTE
jgi:hypothetical protein